MPWAFDVGRFLRIQQLMNFDETTIRTLEGYVPTYAAYGVALNRVYCFRREKVCNIFMFNVHNEEN